MAHAEPVAEAIRQHQSSSAWEYAALSDIVHLWAERFISDFALDVPLPVLSIAPLDQRIVADYQMGHSEIGTRTTICLNLRRLPTCTAVDLLASLAHCLAHAHEEHSGNSGSGLVHPAMRTWHHSVAWRTMMAGIGIFADDHGRHVRIEQRFLDYLNRYGVDTRQGATVLAALRPLPALRATRQMPRWTCACRGGRPVRATTLHALCLDCNTPYHVSP